MAGQPEHCAVYNAVEGEEHLYYLKESQQCNAPFQADAEAAIIELGKSFVGHVLLVEVVVQFSYTLRVVVDTASGIFGIGNF